MKKRMVEAGAESLGGEFFLAEESSVHSCWLVGKLAASDYAAAKKNT